MRKMALDIGTVRIGIATSDPLAIIASGYETYKRSGDVGKDMKYIADLARAKGCDAFVLGLPLNMDGTEGPKVAEIRAFAEELGKYSDLKIAFQDERLSTVSAEKALIESGVRREKRKTVIDKVAATIILQTYLDRIN
jgi:putative Holliday junction resolvase